MNKARRLFTPEALVLVVLAVVLTMISGSLMVWHDEAITLLEIAGNPVGGWTGAEQTLGEMAERFQGTTSPGDLARSLIDTDVHPPIYYWVALGFAEVFGNTIYSARLVSVLSVIAASWLILDLAKRFAPAGRWIVRPMLVFSPTLIYAGTNARSYGLAVLLLTAMIWWLVKALTADKEGERSVVAKNVLLAAVAAALGFLTHYFTILVAGPVFLVATILLVRKHTLAFLGSYVVLLGSLLAAYPFLTVQFGARPDQYSGFNGFAIEGLSALSAAASQFGQIKPADPVSIIGVLLFAVFFFQGMLRLLLRGKDRLDVLIATSAVGPLLCLLGLFWFTDKTLAVEGGRYATFALPGIALLFARVFHRLNTSGGREGAILTAVVGGFLFALMLLPLAKHRGLDGIPWDHHHSYIRIINEVESVETAKAGMIFIGTARGMAGSLVANLDPKIGVLIVSQETTDSEIQTFIQHRRSIVFNLQKKHLHSRSREISDMLRQKGFQPHMEGMIWKRK